MWVIMSGMNITGNKNMPNSGAADLFHSFRVKVEHAEALKKHEIGDMARATRCWAHIRKWKISAHTNWRYGQCVCATAIAFDSIAACVCVLFSLYSLMLLLAKKMHVIDSAMMVLTLTSRTNERKKKKIVQNLSWINSTYSHPENRLRICPMPPSSYGNEVNHYNDYYDDDNAWERKHSHIIRYMKTIQ